MRHTFADFVVQHDICSVAKLLFVSNLNETSRDADRRLSDRPTPCHRKRCHLLMAVTSSNHNKNVRYKYNANTIDNYKMTNNNHGLAKLWKANLNSAPKFTKKWAWPNLVCWSRFWLRPWKFIQNLNFSKIQDGGRKPSWKYTKRHNFAKYWLICTKFGMRTHFVFWSCKYVKM